MNIIIAKFMKYFDKYMFKNSKETFVDEVLFMTNVIRKCPNEIVLDTLRTIDLNKFVTPTSKFSNVQEEDKEFMGNMNTNISIDYTPDNTNPKIIIRFKIGFGYHVFDKNKCSVEANLVFLNYKDSYEFMYDSLYPNISENYALKVNEIFGDIVEEVYSSVVYEVAKAHNTIYQKL